jgi:fructose-bisphosphate aldolase class II
MVDGRQRGYAVPLFCVPSVNAAIGVVRAAEAEQAPVILGMYGACFMRPQAEAVCAGMRALAEEAAVPVSLMLDHGSSFLMCIKAIRNGFTDVMFDGSELPYEENAATTKLICDAAHSVGVRVEAELGHVGLGDAYDAASARAHFTQPDTVARFVAETGVDYLAVSFGTAHGDYKSAPELDLPLLAALNRVSPVPLAMHGGSGLSEDQFRGAIQRGIAKVNIGTHLYLNAARLIAASEGDLFSVEDAITEGFRAKCEYYLRLFGASGKTG